MRALNLAAVTALALSAAFSALCLHAPRALSATCAGSPIEAHGESSRFEWLAKTKARANWRRKVRATPGLGAAYANWAHAGNTEERCLTGPAGSLCIFTGLPCLK